MTIIVMKIAVTNAMNHWSGRLGDTIAVIVNWIIKKSVFAQTVTQN